MRWRRVAVVVVVLASATLAGWVLFDNSDELLAAGDTLTSVSPSWLAVALAAEVVSYVARGGAETVVLRHGGSRIGPVTLGAATLAGDAAAYCLPFGFAASGVVMFGVLRRRQVDAAVAGWLFAVSSVLYVASISVLTIVSVQVAGDDDPVPGLQGISAVLLAVLAVAGGGYALLRRRAMRWSLRRPLRVLARSSRRDPRQDLHRGTLHRAGARTAAWARDWAGRLRAIRVTPAAVAVAFGLMTLSWLTDIAVLALAFLALGATPPWTGLLLAYCAGQIAASMPVTPGGIGVVEGSITVALVAFGGDNTITLAAVLLYRMIAYWGCIPAGGLAWLVLRATSRAPDPPVATEPAQEASAATGRLAAESETLS